MFRCLLEHVILPLKFPFFPTLKSSHPHFLSSGAALLLLLHHLNFMVGSRLNLHAPSTVKPSSFQKECLHPFRLCLFLGAKYGNIYSTTVVPILVMSLYIFSLLIILKGLFWYLIFGKLFFPSFSPCKLSGS